MGVIEMCLLRWMWVKIQRDRFPSGDYGRKVGVACIEDKGEPVM